MGKKRGKPVSTEAPARKGVNVHAWVDEDVGKAFKELVEGFRPKGTTRGHLEEALRDYCRKHGYLPPQEDA